MRFIKKSETFFERHLNNASEEPVPTSEEEATRRWKRLEKEKLHQLLFEEQYGLCAYSELGIEDFKKEHRSLYGVISSIYNPKVAFMT